MAIRAIEKKRYWRLRREHGRPLYLQIRDLILEHIQSGLLKPGDLLPGYPWLSKTMGVADKTVRQAYAVLQQAGVLEIRRGKGTFVAIQEARSAAGGPGTGVISILPGILPVSDAEAPMFWGILRAIQEAAYEERLDSLLMARAGALDSAESVERVADSNRNDGVMVLGTPSDEFLSHLAVLRFPAVLVGSTQPQIAIDSVAFDYAGAGRELAYRLIGEGHKRIGLVRVSRGARAADLEVGYRHAMGATELPVHPEWIVSIDLDLGERGYSAVTALLEQGVTAAIAFDERLVATLDSAARLLGLRIPEQLSVVSLASASNVMVGDAVQLSGLQFDPGELARAAVGRLSELIAGEDAIARREALEGVRMEGASVAPPQGGQ